VAGETKNCGPCTLREQPSDIVQELHNLCRPVCVPVLTSGPSLLFWGLRRRILAGGRACRPCLSSGIFCSSMRCHMRIAFEVRAVGAASLQQVSYLVPRNRSPAAFFCRLVGCRLVSSSSGSILFLGCAGAPPVGDPEVCPSSEAEPEAAVSDSDSTIMRFLGWLIHRLIERRLAKLCAILAMRGL
jgi:hypothetical protein